MEQTPTITPPNSESLVPLWIIHPECRGTRPQRLTSCWLVPFRLLHGFQHTHVTVMEVIGCCLWPPRKGCRPARSSAHRTSWTSAGLGRALAGTRSLRSGIRPLTSSSNGTDFSTSSARTSGWIMGCRCSPPHCTARSHHGSTLDVDAETISLAKAVLKDRDISFFRFFFIQDGRRFLRAEIVNRRQLALN